MSTEAEKVAASQQRARIPLEWQLEFLDWTDDALLSLSEDVRASKRVRAYAAWELDHRLAFNLPPPSDGQVYGARDGGMVAEALRRRAREGSRMARTHGGKA